MGGACLRPFRTFRPKAIFGLNVLSIKVIIALNTAEILMKEELLLIRVIFGEKGAGKTKQIIDMANEMVKESTGSMVFVDDDSRYMFDLKHEIRFVDASEYGIDSPKMF